MNLIKASELASGGVFAPSGAIFSSRPLLPLRHFLAPREALKTTILFYTMKSMCQPHICQEIFFPGKYGEGREGRAPLRGEVRWYALSSASLMQKRKNYLSLGGL